MSRGGMKPSTGVTFGGRYDSRPNASLPEYINSSNIGRSRITESYKGYDGTLDSNVIGERNSKYPTTRRLADEISETEIVKARNARLAFMPKQYQTIYTYLDLSNTNANLDQNSGSYVYDFGNPKYYTNVFGKSGMEKVCKLEFGPISVPAYFSTLGYDLTRLYLSFNITEDIGNKNFSYDVWYYPDNNASTPSRKILIPSNKFFIMNGYCPLSCIQMKIRDIASNVLIPETETGMFVINAIGPNTTLDLANHDLIDGMKIYLNDCNPKKSTFPRIYTVTVLNPDQISINFDSSSMDYLVGQKLSFTVDDWVFNTGIKIESIRDDV